MSGGRRSVERALGELRDLGVRRWAEPLPLHQHDERDMSRSNVFVHPEDRDAAHERYVAGISPAGLAAGAADRQEHMQRVRSKRPEIEMWLEDVAYQTFTDALRTRMTVEQATELERILADDGPTWRALARQVQDRFSDRWRLGSLTPGHQAFGIAPCHVAATMLGEDPAQDPWT